jgi:2-polyprenyl-3-methyl-5-hydroxy-6-metoxy-1,4-benzoquinol methylase
VGCGVGRILGYLAPNATGIDHNPGAVAACRAHGLRAYLPADFAASPRPSGGFDALVAAHVLEHLTRSEADDLLRTYLPEIRPGGRVVLITPQERGQRSDPTHVRFVDRHALEATCRAHDLTPEHSRSFPLPRPMGRWFIYNETIVVARVSESTT